MIMGDLCWPGSIVDEIEETDDVCYNEEHKTHHYPTNYETCATFFSLLKSTGASLYLVLSCQSDDVCILYIS